MNLPWQALCIHPRLTCSSPVLLCQPLPRQGQDGAALTTSATDTVATTILLVQTQPRLLLEILDDTLRVGENPCPSQTISSLCKHSVQLERCFRFKSP